MGLRTVFAALFSDPKKYAALKQALAEIMYRELRQGKVYSFEPATLSMVAEPTMEYGKKENP